MSKLQTVLLGTMIAGLALSSAAHAGGFSRGTADTDILYEPGTFSMRSGLTYVDPQRGFETINGANAGDSTYTGTYQIPSVAIGFGGELFGCAGTYTEPFAAEGDYTGVPGGALPRQVSSTASVSNADRLNFATASTLSQTRRTDFNTNEFGATCRVSYAADFGRVSFLGGVYAEDFRFEGSSFGTTLAPSRLGPLPVFGTQVDVTSEGTYEPGYRIGAAFEKPELALRAQVLYRSEVVHENIQGTGTVRVLSSGIPGLNIPNLPPVGAVLPVTSLLSDSTSPQSLSISAQSGIAPGYLLLASFNWTDWSTNENVVSSIRNTALGINSSSYAPYNWRDGYTGTIGLGRAFTDAISGAIQLGYDRGVSTGSETTYTDLYTLAAGVSFKGEKFGELRFGGLVGYWTDGEQKISDGAYFNGTVGDDMVYAANASLKFTF